MLKRTVCLAAAVLLSVTGVEAKDPYPGTQWIPVPIPIPIPTPQPPQQGPHANVPPGHLPPPGECRIWFPDRPPGHQPPPGNCAVLRFQVPPGAFLVWG
ncbi:MAG: hypothetical protein RLO50_14915 [Azospirillaceae bacterium]